MKHISLLCWNIGNPSRHRAEKQADWLGKRSEDFFVLTETKKSEGCFFFKHYFETRDYHVIVPDIDEREYGTMMISKYPLAKSLFLNYTSLLSSRVVAMTTSLPEGTLEIIGLYVPSRDVSAEKIERKKHFLENVTQALSNAPVPAFRIVCGDFNVLEPDHIPRYRFFKEWEYAFYQNLMGNQLKDAFRYLSPCVREYSWIGRTGDGYRYDHCFVSESILPILKKCFYLHEPREARLSDHSAIIAELSL